MVNASVLYSDPDLQMRPFPMRLIDTRPGTLSADRKKIPSGMAAWPKGRMNGWAGSQPLDPPKTYPKPEWPGGTDGWDRVRPSDVPLGYSVWQWIDSRERNDLPSGAPIPRRFR